MKYKFLAILGALLLFAGCCASPERVRVTSVDLVGTIRSVPGFIKIDPEYDVYKVSFEDNTFQLVHTERTEPVIIRKNRGIPVY